MDEEKILDIRNLRTYFFTSEGTGKVVDGVNLWLKKGETLGLVGESGCGKTMTALSILKLIPVPPGKIMEGSEILFDGKNLVDVSNGEIRKIRGGKIAMIFQEPMTSLNPVFTIGDQIMEAVIIHQKKNRREARETAVRMLELVRIPSPEKRIDDYPHQLSGGMRQRVMIAMALSCNPELLIADEPTTALDVTIQAQIIDLLKELQRELKMAVLIITHDLGIIAEFADRVAIMYAGEIMEQSNTRDIFETNMHPYTEGLLKSIPKMNTKDERLSTIEGTVPKPTEYPSGCKFNTRCPYRFEKCGTHPDLREVKPGHLARCWLRF